MQKQQLVREEGDKITKSTYILKVKKLAESIHEPKKLAEKVRKW